MSLFKVFHVHLSRNNDSEEANRGKLQKYKHTYRHTYCTWIKQELMKRVFFTECSFYKKFKVCKKLMFELDTEDGFTKFNAPLVYVPHRHYPLWRNKFRCSGKKLFRQSGTFWQNIFWRNILAEQFYSAEAELVPS